MKKGNDTGPAGGGTALVTGGALRIGEAIVRELHEAGMRVWIHHHRSGEAATALARELEARRPGSAVTVAGDLADPGTPERVIAALAGEGLDLLVNNASLFRPALLEAIDLAEWEAVMGVNL
ncbi:MAG: SDR family NAD(P)-dependent oxidoreductase, partial [Gammaproteobacteria bacterium]